MIGEGSMEGSSSGPRTALGGEARKRAPDGAFSRWRARRVRQAHQRGDRLAFTDPRMIGRSLPAPPAVSVDSARCLLPGGSMTGRSSSGGLRRQGEDASRGGDLGAAGNRAQPSVFIEYRGDLGRSSAPALSISETTAL